MSLGRKKIANVWLCRKGYDQQSLQALLKLVKKEIPNSGLQRVKKEENCLQTSSQNLRVKP
jgi:hypothetical protein